MFLLVQGFKKSGLLNVDLWSQSYSVPKALVLKIEMLYTSKCQILAPLYVSLIDLRLRDELNDQ